MKSRVVLVLVLSITACATGYRAVLPGVNSVGQMQVTVGEGWLQPPAAEAPYLRNLSTIYTRDGADNDRVLLVPGVSDGQAMFNDGAGLPAFRADMDANELEELAEGSLVALPGLGAATIDVHNQTPYGFGEHSGTKFDLTATVPGGEEYRGLAALVVADERLYSAIFLARYPDYYNAHIADATAVIESLAIRVSTIRFGGF
jgi:hypothetical protein